MKKLFSVVLYKSLMQSDFALTLKNIKKNKRVLKTVFLKSNLTTLLISVKIFLKFVKHMLRKNNEILFYTDQLMYFRTAQSYIKKIGLSRFVNVSKQALINTSTGVDEPTAFLSLHPATAKTVKYFVQRLVFLHMHVNVKNVIAPLGFYEILNKVGDFKKLLFLLILIKFCR